MNYQKEKAKKKSLIKKKKIPMNKLNQGGE